MTRPKKFLLSYDADYDAPIESVLQETPSKRRSQRLRELIYKGLQTEQAPHVPVSLRAEQECNAERSNSLASRKPVAKRPTFDPQ